MFELLDLNRDGNLDFTDFISILESCCRHDSKTITRKLFRIFDLDNDNKINSEDFFVTVMHIKLFNLFPSLHRQSVKVEEEPIRSYRYSGYTQSKTDFAGLFAMDFSKQFSDYPNVLTGKDMILPILQTYASYNACLTLEDFSNFLGDFPSILKYFTKCFREDLWGNPLIPLLKIPKKSLNSGLFQLASSEDHIGNLYIFQNHSISKYLSIVKKRLLIIFNHKKKPSIYQAIYLEGCYLKEECKFGIYVLNLFHCTQYDVRLSLAFRSEEKKNFWRDLIAKAGNIRKLKDFYDLDIKIGMGKFSDVFRAIRKNNKENFVVKIVRKKKLDRMEREMMKNEISIMATLDHPNIIKLLDVFDSQKYMILIIEYVNGQELIQLIKSSDLSEYIISRIIYELLTTILYIHSVGVIHRDLKPENILFYGSSESPRIKIIDFGLATFSYAEITHKVSCGTLGYSAPEILIKQGYNSQIDMWSLGVVTFSLLTGRLPIYDSDRQMIIEKTLNFEIDYQSSSWERYTIESLNFVQSLLQRDPKLRLTPKQALEHQWFKEFK